MKLLGMERIESCRGCLGEGARPTSQSQRVIRVNTSTYVLQCNRCKTLNRRKTSKVNALPKAEKIFASLK